MGKKCWFWNHCWHYIKKEVDTSNPRCLRGPQIVTIDAVECCVCGIHKPVMYDCF